MNENTCYTFDLNIKKHEVVRLVHPQLVIWKYASQ